MPPDLMKVLTSQFFMYLFLYQAIPAFLIAVIVSPSLIAADLSNNALPLYLGRPIDRHEYVLGKMAVSIAEILMGKTTHLEVDQHDIFGGYFFNTASNQVYDALNLIFR